MNPEEKQDYLKRYKEKKAEGELFWPDAISKDAVVSLAIFIVLICLAVFAGVPSEPPANPSDTAYIPRPEWYFMWAFQLLKYFPGQLEGIAIVGLGLVIFVGLFGLPFFDRGPKRHPRNRPIATMAMILIVAAMVFLSIQGVVTTPVSEAEGKIIGGTKAEQVAAGGELFAEHCADCHGAERRRRGDQGQTGRGDRAAQLRRLPCRPFRRHDLPAHQLRAARRGDAGVWSGLRRPAQRSGDSGDHRLHAVLGGAGRRDRSRRSGACGLGQDRESQLRQGREADLRRRSASTAMANASRAATKSTHMITS